MKVCESKLVVLAEFCIASQTFCDEGSSFQEKIEALKSACKRHTALTKECSQGLGQDR